VIRGAVAALLGLVLVARFGTAQAEPAISLGAPAVAGTIRLPENGMAGEAWVDLKLDSLTADDAKAGDPTVVDEPRGGDSVAVAFSVERVQASTATSRTLRLHAEAKGLPPRYSEIRGALVRFGGKDWRISYLLTNQPEAAFTWKIRPASLTIAVDRGDAIPLSIAVSTVSATGIRVVDATGALEQMRKVLMAPEGFRLCQNPSDACDPPTLAAGTSGTFWLRPVRPLVPGHYTGPIAIGADQKPDGDTVSLDVSVSSTGDRVVGVLVLAAGVAISTFWLTVARNRYNRDQAMLPMARLRDRLLAISAVLKDRPVWVSRQSIQRTTDKIDELIAALQPSKLEAAGYLPSRAPIVGTQLPDATRVATYVASVDAWTTVLDRVVRQGMAQAWHHLEVAGDPAKQQLVDDCVASMDGFIGHAAAGAAPDPAATGKMIDDALNKLTTDLTGGRPGQRVVSFRSATEPTGTEQLLIQMHTIAWGIWSAAALISVVAGSYILVFSNLGFGAWTDYIACLFWGFGLPTAASGMAQMTNASVGGAVGVTSSRSG
jgi:hypothetical protein